MANFPLKSSYPCAMPAPRGIAASEWQRIAASVARNCGLRPQGLCDIHCLGLAICDTIGLNLCCPWPRRSRHED